MNRADSPRFRSLSVFLPLLLATVLFTGLTHSMAEARPAHAGPDQQTASSAAHADAAQVITIGVAADLSGPAQSLGWQQLNAVQLAVNQLNAAGGLQVGGASYTLTVTVADSMCSSSQAPTAANQLLDAGAVSVIGHTCSSASLAAQGIYAAAGVPMVTASATAPQLTEQGYTTTFRVVWRDDMPPALLARRLVNSLGQERAAIVELDSFWLNVANDVFSDTFTALGGTISSRHTLTSTDQFTAALTAIMAESPDVIHFAHTDPAVAGTLSEDAHNLNMTDVIISWTSFSGRSALAPYVSAAGAAAEGDMALLYGRDPSLMPGYVALNVAYQTAGFANYGDEVGEWGAFAFDAAQIVFAAIEQANSVEPTAIRQALATLTDYQGVVGLYEGFDSKGDVIPQWAWVESFQDGEWILFSEFGLFLPLVLR